MPVHHRNDLEVLSRDECLDLLRGAGIGRVGLSMDALPVVLPVNFVIAGDRIVFRTGQGTKLSAALRNAVVCFEVDEIDVEHRTGWSVVVTGTAQQLAGVEASDAAALELDPWSPGGDHFIAVSVDLVSGRRVGSLSNV